MILITGATGLTGSAVVRAFARRGVGVRALVRDPFRPRAWGDAREVEVVEGDLLVPGTLPAALDGVGTVVLISGADDRMAEAQINLVDAAVAAGVRRVVKVSGMGADPASPFRFLRLHAEIEGHLRTSGLGWTLLRPSQFMQVYYREVPTMLADGTLAQPLGTARLAPVDVEDVAEAVHAIVTGEGHEGEVHDLTGPEALTMDEVCEVLTSVVGRPIRYVDIDPEVKRRRLVDGGIPPRFADDLGDLFRLRREGGPESRVQVEAFARLGIRPTPFAAFARRSAAVLRGETAPGRLWASGWHGADAGAVG
ncbi:MULTISPECIES: SDR family oxidoreductase [unclassified Streptomyces]|uniref:SDR family oxidoreductase n=1 Tax=unclassified Streptomyces TaxID=2593676 RepID=UPI00068BB04B|nr:MULTISPECIES: SDR family oxidoreductase [unclassified Streptomyces]